MKCLKAKQLAVNSSCCSILEAMAFRSQSLLLPLALAALFASSLTFVSMGPAAPMITALAPAAGQLQPEAAVPSELFADSSVVLAGGEEALFYIFILLATLITLILSVVLREAPRVWYLVPVQAGRMPLLTV